MADQRDIIIRAGDASPTDIILYSGDPAPVVSNDITIYDGDANPTTIILRGTAPAALDFQATIAGVAPMGQGAFVGFVAPVCIIGGVAPMGQGEFICDASVPGAAAVIAGVAPMGSGAFVAEHAPPASTNTGVSVIAGFSGRRARDRDRDQARREHRERLPQLLRAIHMAGGVMHAIAPMGFGEFVIEHEEFSDAEIDEMIDTVDEIEAFDVISDDDADAAIAALENA